MPGVTVATGTTPCSIGEPVGDSGELEGTNGSAADGCVAEGRRNCGRVFPRAVPTDESAAAVVTPPSI